MPLPLAPIAALALKGVAKRYGPRLALWALAGVVLVPAVLVVLLFGAGVGGAACDPSAAAAGGSASLSDTAKKTLKAKFIPIYIDAAQKFELGPRGWAFLASIHGIENNFADSGGSPTSGPGAQGPMQFMPATWAAYQTDGDGDGVKDVQNVYDAIFGAAKYLRASGAPKSWDDAVFSYNHADWYVDMVKAAALDYLGDGDPTQFASDTSPSSEECTCAGAPGASDTAPGEDGGGGRPLPGKPPRIFWPTPTKTVSSPFGYRWGRLHAGLDIPVASGTPLTAAAGGKVVLAGWTGGYGNYTCLQHARSFSTCYGHQSNIGVRVGQNVAAGQRIGLSGNTGNSTGPHLHFETRIGKGLAGTPVDPAPYLKGAALRAAGSMPTATQGVASGACAQSVSLIDGGKLLWPLANKRGKVGQGPGVGTHSDGAWQSRNAIDITTPVGTPVVAVADGRVCSSCGFGGSAGSGRGHFDGKRLTLDTAANQVFYTHLKRLSRRVKPGARVKRGQVIGWTWMANSVPHLHIAVKNGDVLELFGLTGARNTAPA